MFLVTVILANQSIDYQHWLWFSSINWKHATAVFSSDIPPAITFLNPDKTLEQTAGSLRDSALNKGWSFTL